ncbi:hypothetical protein U9M48_001014, partial [Paspalum notatum var. saurae]
CIGTPNTDMSNNIHLVDIGGEVNEKLSNAKKGDNHTSALAPAEIKRQRERERYNNRTGEDATNINANDTNKFDSGFWEPDDPMHGIEESRYEYFREPNSNATKKDPYDFVYNNLPKSHFALKKVPNCQYCGAKKFPGEGPAFCCRKGLVSICTTDVPNEIQRLFKSQSDTDAKYFRKNIRYFNSHFSFTSFGVSLDRRLATARGTEVYTFKAHGQIYHKMDQLVPGDKGPRHMQLYFYDTDETIAHRTKRSPHLDADLIKRILNILQNNPYVQSFKSLGNVGNLEEYNIALNTTISVDQRRFNAPAMEQVAAIWKDGNDPEHRFERSIVVHGKSDHAFYVRHYHRCYDPLAYPLFFPSGETGWEDKNIPYRNPTTSEPKRASRKRKRQDGPALNMHDSANDNIPRDEDPDDEQDNIDNIGRDAEGQEVKEPRQHVSAREYYCNKLQIHPGKFNVMHHGGRLFQQWAVDMYVKGLLDTLSVGEARASHAGKRVVLSKAFHGSDRDVHSRFMDAMTLVTRFGKPDFFVTMTCNPYWDEIMAELLPGQTPQDRPDVVARVYRAKLLDLHDFLIKKGHLGKVAAWAHVTEFQQRGLPHEHFLLIMEPGSKLKSPDDYDKFTSAEIPDKEKYPELNRLVCKHMMHGPCGDLNPKCPCMIDRQCRFRYPRQFCEATQQGKDSYPIYRRRKDGQIVKIRKHYLDNGWVVPYNPVLLMRYNCHINVEICSSIKSCKYLYKYIHKGHDMASFAFGQHEDDETEINEIKQYRNARMITAIEAVYRLFGFPLYSMNPPVLQMQVHLPGMHMVAYKATDDLNDVVQRAKSQRSMLTEFFKMNSENLEARKYLYREFPEHFRWIKANKQWVQRKQRPQIGRLVYANPAEGERFYLRVLLNHVRGPTSFEHLRTFHGVTYPTFRAACEAMGLVDADKSLDDSLTEAPEHKMPCALRRLFAIILAYYGMAARDYYRELNEEIKIGFEEEDLKIIETLNREQRAGYDDIMDHVINDKPQVFFVDGPGGTGKTYLYRALLAKVRSMDRIAIATAISGIAASIMPGGRTAHSRFKIPIKLGDSTMCNFTKQSGTAELLRRAALIIWDEVSMTKRQAVETLDRTMRDIMESSLPFGGKVMLFGGDFRQVLPVVPRGTRAQITDATLLRSYIWNSVWRIQLTRNMRAQSDTLFAEYLLRIGNGIEKSFGDDYVQLPDDIILSWDSKDIGDKKKESR